MSQTHYVLVGRDVVSVEEVGDCGARYKTEVLIATTLVGCVRVSTKFCGPRLGKFMTLVFGGPLHGTQACVTTYAEAESQHAEMVERVRKAEGQ